MARLTKRYEKSGKVTLDAAQFEIDQTVLDTEINNSEPIAAAVKKLAEYEDAEEKGLLAHLPCKVSDTVWDYELRAFRVDVVCFYGNGITFTGTRYRKNGECGVTCTWNADRIGKTVFLTPEAAKQALKADKKEVEPILIEDMSFSVRTYNCLQRAGVKTLQDLSKRTEQDLMKVRNLGTRCIKEIIEKCKLYGVDIISESENAE